MPIPAEILLTADAVEATRGADVWVSAIPTVHLRSTLERVRQDAGPAGVPVVSLSKGIERGTFARPSEIIRAVLGAESVAVLSGPSHAEEVARGLPTTVVAASDEEGLALAVQRQFSTERFRVYTNLDPVGVELAGALKNVMGLAAGIAVGLGCGDNALSALMTRGLAEMSRFGVALGADPGTFAGLAGLGDLITTCVSPHGRNRAVGLRLGRGEPLERILEGMPQVARGRHHDAGGPPARPAHGNRDADHGRGAPRPLRRQAARGVPVGPHGPAAQGRELTRRFIPTACGTSRAASVRS